MPHDPCIERSKPSRAPRPHAATIFLAGATSLGLAAAAPADSGLWWVAMPDRSSHVVAASDLAIDPAGRPHIVYTDEANNRLKYAYRDGVVWQNEVIFEGFTAFNAIAIHPVGVPCVAFTDSVAVRYGCRDAGGQWVLDGIPGFLLPVGEIYLGFGADGRAGIVTSSVYVEGTSGLAGVSASAGLGFVTIFAYRTDAGWASEVIPSRDMLGVDYSAVWDSDGQPRVVMTGSDFNLDVSVYYYARRIGPQAWVQEVIEEDPFPWAMFLLSTITLALDGADVLHVLYGRFNPLTPESGTYAVSDGAGGWTYEDTPFIEPGHVDRGMGIDPSGRAYLLTGAGGGVNLQVRTGPGEWVIEEIDPNIYAATSYGAVAKDLNGFPRLTYKGADSRLRYARYIRPGGEHVSQASE